MWTEKLLDAALTRTLSQAFGRWFSNQSAAHRPKAVGKRSVSSRLIARPASFNYRMTAACMSKTMRAVRLG